MLLALGAASTAIDALIGLTSTKQASPAASNGHPPANLFAFQADATASTGATAGSASGGSSQISPETMSALLAAQGQASQGATIAPKSREDALKDLFGLIDADHDGKITKDEFESALGAGGTNLAKADEMFGKLDKNADNSVSLDEMSSALMGRGRAHGHHHAGGAGGSDGQLGQALKEASSTTVTNADGSTTTSLTYADGSQVTMTTPAAASGGASPATASYNAIERMIQRQAALISARASSSLSVSV